MAFFDGLVKGFTNLFGVEPNNLPLVGSAFTNENEKDLVRRMEEAAQAYKNMAPAHAEAQGQALENQMAAYNPMNAMLGAMGGPQAQIDFEQIFQPVFSEGHPAYRPPPSASPAPAGPAGPQSPTIPPPSLGQDIYNPFDTQFRLGPKG